MIRHALEVENGNRAILFPYPDRRGNTLEEARKSLPDDIWVECSTDMQYLTQYYYIREYAYRTDLRVKMFSGDEDEIDRRSHLLIARKGHFCLGGARLTISTVDKPEKLPVERGDFNVLEQVPRLKGTNYCELGRTAILPQYRDSAALHHLFKLALDIAQQHGCQYMVGASPPAVARLFHRTYRHLGYEAQYLKHVAVPMGAENSHLNLMFNIMAI